MILVDANLLIYSVSESSPNHDAAREWLDARLTQPGRVGLPWPSLLGFLRIVTKPRIFEKRATFVNAWSRIESWLDCPNVWVPLPTERYGETLGVLVKAIGRGANLAPDADLAALAIEHGLTLCTADAGFSRSPGLKWKNPLGAAS